MQATASSAVVTETRMSDSSTHRRRKLIGLVYEKRGEIGRGTYGTVYDGVQIETGRRVAIKKVSGSVAAGEAEATILGACKGAEHVVQMLDVVRENGKVYLILEFMDTDLETILSATDAVPNIEIAHVKGYLQMLLRGVQELHERKILHRDLKPNNLLIRCDDRVAKITDFGMAVQLADGDEQKAKSLQVVTRAYRSPELIFGDDKYTTEVDIWSVGCIFAEMLLRKPYFDGSSDIDQLSQIFTALGSPSENGWVDASALPFYLKFKDTQPKPLSEQFPDLSVNGVDLLSKLLQLDPKKRISAENALKHAFFTEEPAAVTGESLPVAMPIDPTKKRPLADLLAEESNEESDSVVAKGRRIL